MFPPAGSPEADAMLRWWMQSLQGGFQLPPGLLDQEVPRRVGPQPQGLLQPVGDILKFRQRQGLLGLEGEGAPRPGGGPRIGSPEWTRAYEAQQGLRPGALRPVEPPQPTRFPTEFAKRDFGKWNEKKRGVRVDQPSQKQVEQAQRNEASAEALAKAPGPTKDYKTGKILKGSEALPPELLAKINAYANYQKVTPAERRQAILDAANIKSARQAWESYSPESLARGIDPPGMMSGGSKLALEAKRWIAGGKGRLPFDNKSISDRFNQLPTEQRETFNRIMFPQDYQ
jgi:hypothetical protein